MKNIIFALLVIAFVACRKEEDPVTQYPIVYSFDRIDQNSEGLYLVTSTNTLSDLPTNIGLYGAYKDSLKSELRKVVAANIDLQEVELVSPSELKFHYIYQGHSVITPTSYSFVNGKIIIPDSLFTSLIFFDKESDQFYLCGSTTFALPGPNAGFPFAPPYFQFNPAVCIDEHSNENYAVDFLNTHTLEPLDTIGVLITRYIYSKM